MRKRKTGEDKVDATAAGEKEIYICIHVFFKSEEE